MGLRGNVHVRQLCFLESACPDYAVLNVNNDNQFNVKVDIQDANLNTIHLSARVDFLVVPRMVNKQMALVDIFSYTIAFIEVESNGKGLELACLQLLTSLKAISHLIGKRTLFGIVISADFDEAQLIKHDYHGCFTNGTFHPSMLNAVVSIILNGNLR
jgi:hypothetical protein